MRTVNPDYVMPLFTDVIGRYMLAGAILMQILGSFVLWKIVNIKV
jgi:tight adherence protein B